MPDALKHPAVFVYRAQASDGARLDGTIEAPDADQAAWRLRSMGLRVIELRAASESGPVRRGGGALSADDFAAFNEQLALLTDAAMPIEQGLRLIAQDMRRGRLAASVRAVAGELEAGMSLGEAFEAHRDRFPPLYGKLIELGVRTGNLSAVLMNLGRHLSLRQRMRAAVWKSAAYPLAMLVGLVAVMTVMGYGIGPQLEAAAESAGDGRLPVVTALMLAVWRVTPIAAGAVLVAAVLAMLTWMVMRWAGLDDMAASVPIAGPIVRRALASRWCDLIAIATAGGMDLPTAMDLAAEAIGGRAAAKDAAALRKVIESGGLLTDAPPLRIVGPQVAAAMQLAGERGDLPGAMRSMSELLAQQAEQRLRSVTAPLGPALLLIIAAMIALTIFALLSPLRMII